MILVCIWTSLLYHLSSWFSLDHFFGIFLEYFLLIPPKRLSAKRANIRAKDLIICDFFLKNGSFFDMWFGSFSMILAVMDKLLLMIAWDDHAVVLDVLCSIKLLQLLGFIMNNEILIELVIIFEIQFISICLFIGFNVDGSVQKYFSVILQLHFPSFHFKHFDQV